MLSEWRKEYSDLMVRTRAVGIVGACLMVLAVILKINATYEAMLIAEIAFVRDLPRTALIQVGLAVLVGIVFCGRVGVLLLAKRLPYYSQIFSWFLSFAVAAMYVYNTSPFYQTTTVCDSYGVCFGIYDMSSTFDWVILATSFWPIVSLIRFATTSIFAALRVRNKFT